MDTKLSAILIILVLAGIGIYYAYTKGYEAGFAKGIILSQQIEAGDLVTNPMEKMPSANPFENIVNPFAGIYKNPFK